MSLKQLAIVIPAYKGTFFKQTIESIVNQTCKDFTLYVGDDCSSYPMEMLISQYKDKIDIVYKRFDHNLGGQDLVAQWHRCIDMTKGEPYIWLFSDDDIMQPRCVEVFLALPKIERDNYLVRFHTNMFGEKDKELPKWDERIDAMEYLERRWSDKLVNFVVEFIFPREVYNRKNGFQHFDLAWGSDSITWLKFSSDLKGFLSLDIPDANVLWRYSDENISPNKSSAIAKRKIEAWIDNAVFIKQFLLEHGKELEFKYFRFVFRAIRGYTDNISTRDICSYKEMFVKKIGFPFLAEFSKLKLLLYSFLKKIVY